MLRFYLMLAKVAKKLGWKRLLKYSSNKMSVYLCKSVIRKYEEELRNFKGLSE